MLVVLKKRKITEDNTLSKDSQLAENNVCQPTFLFCSIDPDEVFRSLRHTCPLLTHTLRALEMKQQQLNLVRSVWISKRGQKAYYPQSNLLDSQTFATILLWFALVCLQADSMYPRARMNRVLFLWRIKTKHRRFCRYGNVFFFLNDGDHQNLSIEWEVVSLFLFFFNQDACGRTSNFVPSKGELDLVQALEEDYERVSIC